MNSIARFGVALLLLAALGQARAEVHCDLKDTETTCRDKIQVDLNKLRADLNAQVGCPASGDCRSREWPCEESNRRRSLREPDAATSFSDFFSTLKAAVDSGSTGADDDQAIGFARRHRSRLPSLLRRAPGFGAS
jgi:hypothetical protein